MEGVDAVLEARQRELLSAGHPQALLKWQSGCLLTVLAALRAAAREAGGGLGGGGGGARPPGAAGGGAARARALAVALSEVRARPHLAVTAPPLSCSPSLLPLLLSAF